MADEADRSPGDAATRPQGFALRALLAASVSAGVALLLILLWYAADVLLLVFAAVLLAVALRSLCDMVGHRTKLSDSWSLAIVSAALLLAVAGAALLLAPRVSRQVDALTENLPRAFNALAERANHYGWARRVMAEMPPPIN